MVLMAAASDHRHRHRHRRATKSSRQDIPVTPSPYKVPEGKESAGAGLQVQGISFSWGAQRRLRCSKDGAPANASPSPPPSPPTQHPHSSSPDMEMSKPPQETPSGIASSRPQRPRNLRPHRYAASSRPEGAVHQATLQSPSPSAHAPKPRKRGFAVALTAEEIARDFAAIRRCHATRPVPAARRSSNKKRPRAVQYAIDKMCPGLMLQDVDLHNYKIQERGLKR